MPANLVPSASEFLRISPEILLTLVGTLMMTLESMFSRKRTLGVIAFIALFAAIGLSVAAHGDPGEAFHGMIRVDGFTTFFRILVFATGMLTILMSANYLEKAHAESAEFYALLVFCIVGQSLMVSSNELIMIFIGLETSSIASYVLAGYLRADRRNSEAALKYFLLGSFATAFLLYGVAWTYGITGTTNLTAIRQFLLGGEGADSALLLLAAAALMFVGFAFKVSAAPFQMWAPDVYQGAPAPVSAFLSAGPKAAAFAMFFRVALTAFEPIKGNWEPLLWASALATMVIGNFAALRQTNIKRLLAYSSIAHAGYVMVALTTASETGTAAAMFYLAAYAAMNLGAFAVVTHVARRGERYVEVNDMAGLSIRQPATAALFTIFLLSLIGVPLTGGFFGKFYIFKAALDANLVWLTVLGLLNSAVAAYYYLRIVVVMYMQPPAEDETVLESPSAGIAVTIWATAVATVLLGVLPGFVLDFAGRSASLAR
mgnify:CR=1 FL=1